MFMDPFAVLLGIFIFIGIAMFIGIFMFIGNVKFIGAVMFFVMLPFSVMATPPKESINSIDRSVNPANTELLICVHPYFSSVISLSEI